MKDFFVPKDLLLFSNSMGMNSNFSVRGFSGGTAESIGALTVTVSVTATELTTEAGFFITSESGAILITEQP